MSASKNRQLILKEVPKGKLTPEHFQLRESEIPQPGEEELLVKVRYISIDAANRAWMQGTTYRAAVKAGDIMAGYCLGEVVESGDSKFKKGDLVFGDCGWQEYAVRPSGELNKLPALEPVTHLLSVYGVTGLTAYFGLLEIGEPKPGETLVISAAGGAVGSVAGQIGKIQGCRVVGIAGSDAKCAWVTDELGFDAAINYKTGNVHAALQEACPDKIDIYFDNVGGEILEAALFQTNANGRIICCGMVSGYDGELPMNGPRGIPGLLVVNRILMRGFIVTDFIQKFPQAFNDLAKWVSEGKIKVKEDIVEGLQNTPQALIGLLHGDNVGKRLVKVA
jgi:NADPH-dependent curcumin reductase CurA